MNELAGLHIHLPAMSPQAVSAVRELESRQMSGAQVPIRTDHLIHGGMYHRTIMLSAGVVLTGALLKISTVLTIYGRVTVFTGDDEITLSGFHVVPGSAGRKTAFIAHADTWMTMSFPTSATTVEQAESEFTDEAHLLISRRDGAGDTTTITGE